MGIEPKVIGLFGLFGTGNLGNDGSLDAMVRLLRRVAPQERLLCICGDPSAVEKVFGVEAISIYSTARTRIGGRMGALLQKAAGRATLWLHATRHLRRLKALVVPGTGVLDDFTASPLGWPIDILTWCLLARLMGVRVIFVSVGAGPIGHPLSRWLMKLAARAAHYRSYRDTTSKVFMESIGFDTRNDPVYPDLAFGLPVSPTDPPKDLGSRPLIVGVGVMAYGGWRNNHARSTAVYATYLEKITSFVVWLLDQGYAVRVLLGDQMDRRAVDDLSRAVDLKRPDRAADSIVFAPVQTLHEVMRQMADIDLVVATRYHNLVCALRVGRPTISIGYAHKNDSLLAEMGLANYCQYIERLNIQLLQRQTKQMIADRLDVERRIRKTVTHFESRLQQQEALVVRLICGDARSPQNVD